MPQEAVTINTGIAAITAVRRALRQLHMRLLLFMGRCCLFLKKYIYYEFLAVSHV